MPVNNWARGAEVRVIGELHGSRTQNVWHFATDEVASDTDALNALLLALAEAMRDCIVEVLLPAVTSDWKFIAVEAQEIFPVLSDTIFATGVPENVGELSATSVSFAAAQLNLRTGIGGRRARGKKFLPPPGESEIAQSTIDGPTLVLIAAFVTCVATKFMGTSPTSNWHLGVWSRTDSGGLFANFNTGFRLVTSINPVAEMATMRSRKKGRGE